MGWGGGVGWWGGVVAHVIIVSAQSKELGFWFFRLGLTFGLLGQGIGDLDLGLTIFLNLYQKCYVFCHVSFNFFIPAVRHHVNSSRHRYLDS